jgi:hypothetical protein
LSRLRSASARLVGAGNWFGGIEAPSGQAAARVEGRGWGHRFKGDSRSCPVQLIGDQTVSVTPRPGAVPCRRDAVHPADSDRVPRSRHRPLPRAHVLGYPRPLSEASWGFLQARAWQEWHLCRCGREISRVLERPARADISGDSGLRRPPAAPVAARSVFAASPRTALRAGQRSAEMTGNPSPARL